MRFLRKPLFANSQKYESRREGLRKSQSLQNIYFYLKSFHKNNLLVEEGCLRIKRGREVVYKV